MEAVLKTLPKFLDSHQNDGVKWVLTRKNSYLAHAPGAGKTLQAIIASLMTAGKAQVLFIVPPSLTINWEREILQWTAKLGIWASVMIIPESGKQDKITWRADFIVCPDSMLTKDWVLDNLIKLPKRFVAVDEASRFKEPSAQRTIALFGGVLKSGREVPGLLSRARHSVLMDGSPMPNRPMELWAPTFALAPEAIDHMDQEEFGFKFCGPTQSDRGHWEFKHSSNETELRERLQKNFMHVIDEERLDHPERRRSLLFTQLNNNNSFSPEMKSWERRHLKTLNFDDVSEDMNQGDIAKYRRELGIAKIPFITSYVADRLQNKTESILLFCWHRDVVLELGERLGKYNPGIILGGTNENDREKFFRDFQNLKRKVLVLNIGAGGRGHNLQAAGRVIFGEFSWTDELNKQCEKRASRRGNTKEFIRSEYIVATGTLDEPILNAVFRKAESVKKVIG